VSSCFLIRSPRLRNQDNDDDEEMDGILREFEKLENKQINKPLISSVDRITQLLEETKRKIQHGIDIIEWTSLMAWLDPENTASHMGLLKAKYSAETSKILEHQKDSHKALANCTKVLQNVCPAFYPWFIVEVQIGSLDGY